MATDTRRELALANVEAAIERNLAAAPPLTEYQIKRLRGLLNTGERYTPPPPPKLRPETDEEMDHRLGAILSERLSACGRCGISKARHGYPEHYGYISHQHEPMTVAEVSAIVGNFAREEHPRLMVEDK